MEAENDVIRGMKPADVGTRTIEHRGLAGGLGSRRKFRVRRSADGAGGLSVSQKADRSGGEEA